MEVQRSAFIVRIWAEDEAGISVDGLVEATIRGSIQRVDDRTIRYFASLEQVADLMAEMLTDEHR